MIVTPAEALKPNGSTKVISEPELSPVAKLNVDAVLEILPSAEEPNSWFSNVTVVEILST
ncbi:hypothetical protein D3C80_1766060 [compost metagenome]